ncbi:hypothetical protein N7539_008909 [Penicillium diatomitis]|uniref:Fe2OG dioxygenase domain-containing protein n=1 Tax=Penicillium diatomitis TaxID=2819901 RepID=A0A9W9WKR5_9EURO|nr:uncharacterized protein N7539_008909 [Penicillium diatomitis]KAJ5469291.1 hypothetical protein N7539_008909 [Penicillium diatomitis]
MSKRTLESFFKPKASTNPAKRVKTNDTSNDGPLETNETDAKDDATTDTGPPDTHPSYPIPIPQLPSHISVGLTHGTPAKDPRAINNQPDLDLLYFQPFIARPTANELFKFLRRELPFYRVQYTIKRGTLETEINTPRYTTVFGIDDTSMFIHDPDRQPSSKGSDSTPDLTTEHKQGHPQSAPFSTLIPVEKTSKTPIRASKYQYTPRPIPPCLTHLQTAVESATGATYNFCLVNYYADGNDSISYHSDDERFLGALPDIASLSLGGEREFLMKHKPPPQTSQETSSPATITNPAPGSVAQTQPIKMPLSSGDMVVMRGSTQSQWLHSIPKRKGKRGDAVRGRINITFRRAMIPAGTNNYYRYNVGVGPVWRWDESEQEMMARPEKFSDEGAT